MTAWCDREVRAVFCARGGYGSNYLLTALEDQALWHERDISHSSAERIIVPDACTLLDYMLRLMADIVEGMTVDRARPTGTASESSTSS